MTKQKGITEAQKRASKKWEQKYKRRIFRLPFDKDKELVELAKRKNESVNSLLIRLIDNELNK